MSAQHTPGPWTWHVGREPQTWEICSGPEPTLGYTNWLGLAIVHGCDDRPTEGQAVGQANARLIAAAPELLEALVALRLAREQDKYRSWEKGMPRFNEAETMADAAIAKATGSAA